MPQTKHIHWTLSRIYLEIGKTCLLFASHESSVFNCKGIFMYLFTIFFNWLIFYTKIKFSTSLSKNIFFKECINVCYKEYTLNFENADKAGRSRCTLDKRNMLVCVFYKRSWEEVRVFILKDLGTEDLSMMYTF